MIDNAFSAQTLASDLARVHEIYTDFFAGLSAADWRYPATADGDEWNLREVVAHLAALTTLGQDSVEAALRGETIAFPGLPDRFAFSQFNRQQIDERLTLSPTELSTAFLTALSRSIETASTVMPAQLGRTVELPIYNRPIRVDELLGIQVMHPGLTHAAQVAEPAGAPPLWTHMVSDVRQRTISRVARALSLLYRQDLGGDLEAVLLFNIGGAGGGTWHVVLSPQGPRSARRTAPADLTLTFRDTSEFCRMFTGRLNLLGALLTGRMRPRGMRPWLTRRPLMSPRSGHRAPTGCPTWAAERTVCRGGRPVRVRFAARSAARGVPLPLLCPSPFFPHQNLQDA